MSPPPQKKSSVLVALDSDFDSESSDGEEANKADTQVDHRDDAEHSRISWSSSKPHSLSLIAAIFTSRLTLRKPMVMVEAQVVQ